MYTIRENQRACPFSDDQMILKERLPNERRGRPFENSTEKEVGSDKRVSNGRWASCETPYKADLESRPLLSVRLEAGTSGESAATA